MFSQSDGTFQCQCKPGIYGEKCDIAGTYCGFPVQHARYSFRRNLILSFFYFNYFQLLNLDIRLKHIHPSSPSFRVWAICMGSTKSKNLCVVFFFLDIKSCKDVLQKTRFVSHGHYAIMPSLINI